MKRVARALLGPAYQPLARAYRSAVPAEGDQLSQRPLVFDDRSTGRSVLLIVLAGYKPQLWPKTLERIARHTETELADICVVCSGNPPDAGALRQIAAQKGWSFLQSHEDRLAHAQNLAVRQFGDAGWIAKLDEDMFVTPGWLERLLKTQERAESEGKYQIGFVAPLIPINGFGYRLFLELTGTLAEYEAAFPEYPPISAAQYIGAHHSPAVAEWLWRKTHPLDDCARELANHGDAYSVCPHRFSIGAILLRRQVHEAIGGFAVAPEEGALGYEESELCKWCMDESHAIVVSHSSLVAHFSFFPQWEHMERLLLQEGTLFD